MKAAVFVLVFLTLTLAFTGKVFAASMSLSPATLTKAVGDTFTVDIVVDPESGTISAASAIIDFDPTKLTAVSVTKGSMFNQDPLTNTTDATKGEIRYDSGSLGGSGITTRGTMATITFKAVSAGTAQVTFVFDPTATTGTSLVAAASGPNNLLTTVNNGSFTISSGAVVVQPLPATGVVENTLVIIVGGLLFIGSGLLLARRF